MRPSGGFHTVRWGIVGAGMMGQEHIQNLLAVDGATVTAIADPDPGMRDAAAALAGPDTSVYTDHRALLESGECDAVVVASPNHTHRAVLDDVLATDLAVLVEKPMCTTVEDCRAVVAATEERSAPVWVGLEYRYMPPIARLIDEVRGGATGDVRMVAIREHRFPFLVKVDNWNRFSRNTGGTLVEKCCHFFDLMTLLTGARPVRVMASGGQDVNHLDEEYDGERSDILDNAFVIVEYDNGARGHLDLCMFAEATRDQEEISVVGDAGKVEALVPADVVRIGRRGEHWIGGVEVHPVVNTAAYQGLHHGSSFVEHQKLHDIIVRGGEPEVTVHDGLLSVAVGIAAHRSIDEQRPVELAEILA
jgi:myo-inositol 2-dehydrogenase/D-chiro-inositol 1-dehydrogenase